MDELEKNKGIKEAAAESNDSQKIRKKQVKHHWNLHSIIKKKKRYLLPGEHTQKKGIIIPFGLGFCHHVLS